MNYKYLIILPLLLFLSCQKEDLANLNDSFTVRRNGADMPAYVYGDATSKTFLVTLHGGPGGTGLDLRSGWQTTVEDKYAVVYWDQRGSGMSQGHLSEDNLNLDEMVTDVTALVQVLKHKYGEDINLFLLGHSWGTMLGTAMLTDNNGLAQDQFKGWISAASVMAWCPLILEEYDNFITVAEEQISLGNEKEYWESAIQLANEIDYESCEDGSLNVEAYKAEDILQKSGVIDPTDKRTTFQSQFLQNNKSITTFSDNGTSALLLGNQEFVDTDLSNDLPTITLPTLVLHGKYDLPVPYSVGVSYYENIGSSEKEMIAFEKSGHQLFQTESDKFATAVMEFMERYE